MRKSWTRSDIETLTRLYPDTSTHQLAKQFNCSLRAIYCKAVTMNLKKSRAYIESPLSGWIKKNERKSPATEFKAGQVPHNKGMKGWQAGGNSEQTKFKPGRRPHNTQPVGAERIANGGYLERKMTDTGQTRKDWIGIHHLVWKEHHGEILPGHIVIFRNGDKTDTRIENLEMISRAENMARNTIHNLPPALVEVIHLRIAIKRRIGTRLKREAHHAKQD